LNQSSQELYKIKPGLFQNANTDNINA